MEDDILTRSKTCTSVLPCQIEKQLKEMLSIILIELPYLLIFCIKWQAVQRINCWRVHYIYCKMKRSPHNVCENDEALNYDSVDFIKTLIWGGGANNNLENNQKIMNA